MDGHRRQSRVPRRQQQFEVGRVVLHHQRDAIARHEAHASQGAGQRGNPGGKRRIVGQHPGSERQRRGMRMSAGRAGEQ